MSNKHIDSIKKIDNAQGKSVLGRLFARLFSRTEKKRVMRPFNMEQTTESREQSTKNSTHTSWREKIQSMKKLNRKILWTGSSMAITLGAVFLSVSFFTTRGATFGWLQTDWSGGADTVSTATHTTNQSGWTKFFSKDANIDTTTTPGQASLSTTVANAVTTTDTDFNAFARTGTTVSGTGSAGTLYAQKPDGGTCTTDNQCVGGFCNGGLCATPGANWQMVSACKSNGGAYTLAVYTSNAGSYQWQTSAVSCVGPQCSAGVLVADNTVDFSSYPARNACKTVGGRLPTLAELSCIYTNRASYTGAFGTGNLWSATESSATGAYLVSWYNGSQYYNFKTTSFSVRCVQGQ